MALVAAEAGGRGGCGATDGELAFARGSADFGSVVAKFWARVAAAAATRVEVITMGRGDKRTAKGKRKAKSHGNSRPKNSKLRKLKEAGDSE